MKKSIISLVLLVTVGVLCASGFSVPSAEQISSAAKSPAEVAALIADATPDQAADVVVAIVQAIDGMELSLAEKQKQVEDLFLAVQKEWGDKAMVLLAMTAERVNPELLPVVATVGPGAALPSPPPLGERYLGQ